MTNHKELEAIDVLIAGSGAAGLVLALDLARRGIHFRLIDKLEAPFAGSRGKGIQPRSMEIFEELGVLQDLFANGSAYPPVHTYDGETVTSNSIHEQRLPTPAEPHVVPLMVPQWRTEEILRAHLLNAGYAPEFGTELVAFEQDATGVTATLTAQSGTQYVRARFLIGTDGGRSFVRQALNIAFPGESHPMRAIVADLQIDNLARNAWHRWPKAEGGQLALCPLPGTTTFQMTAELRDGNEPDLSDENIMRLITQRCGNKNWQLHPPVWRSAFRVSTRLAEHYRVGHALIAGDAAHVHPPTGGQGLNTSIQDAYNLGWKLAAVLQGAPDALLDTYEAERRPIAADMLGMSMGYLKDMQQKKPMQRGRDTQQLDLNYRDSVLTQELGLETNCLQAGDRAPDALLRNASGDTVRLFDVLKGPQFTLLAYQVDLSTIRRLQQDARISVITIRAPETDMTADLVDAENHCRNAYGLTTGQLVLIRPDAYVALIANALNHKIVAQYLAHWLGMQKHNTTNETGSAI